MHLPLPIDSVKGFLAAVEGEALYRHATSVCPLGPLLEVGSYCGRSTIYLGTACRDAAGVVYAVDHHRGSEEHQAGEAFHDPELYDGESGQVDTLGEFRRNIKRAGLTDFVIPVVASSTLFARHFTGVLGMVFIDGGHSLDTALADYRSWASRIASGGLLAIHDVFADPVEGGQAPATVFRYALASGLFEWVDTVQSLRFLRRL